jgi:hypothetical protein
LLLAGSDCVLAIASQVGFSLMLLRHWLLLVNSFRNDPHAN